MRHEIGTTIRNPIKSRNNIYIKMLYTSLTYGEDGKQLILGQSLILKCKPGTR
jgi:hypothetical protein